MPPNRFESEVGNFLEGSHGDRTHIKRAGHHTVTPLCGTLLPAGVEGAGEWGSRGPGCGARGRRHNPAPNKFRMQFPHDTNRCTLKNRRIPTIRFQHLKYTQGNCMRNCWLTEGPHCGARGWRRGLAGLRGDAPSEARGADGSRAGRRPRAHQAARPGRAHRATLPGKAPGTPVGPHSHTATRGLKDKKSWWRVSPSCFGGGLCGGGRARRWRRPIWG